ncbi:MAG TPA: nucleotide-binding protein [Gemmatimonadaceae bacterium]|nr:nucleotide-binding protein [Gemmatimonadaceae bacterium]
MTIATRVFVGSSKEALPVANAVVSLLRGKFDVALWTKDVFTPGSYAVESLLKEVERCAFAVFVFAPDDVALIRDTVYSTTRDNVIFELGLFMSKLGRARCFFLLPTGVQDFKIPSDLFGVTALVYDFTQASTDPKSSVDAAIRELEHQVHLLTFGDGTTVSLSGNWHQMWAVESGNYPPKNESTAELRQLGNRVDAAWETDGRVFIVNGEIQRGDMLTGTWSDRERGPAYFGAFQLKIDPKCRRMTGKWVGFSQSGEIKTGDWVWNKTD